MPTPCGRRRIFGIALIALSLVPLTGFGGQVSLCQMSFAAIGALVMAHHGQGGDPMALLLAAVVCAVVGALVALPALRLSGLYLALATAAFAVFLDRWVFLFRRSTSARGRSSSATAGSSPSTPSTSPASTRPTGRRSSWCWRASSRSRYLLVVAVRRSGFGQRLLAMKDSPAACATLGIDVTRLKLSVFALSAAMAGVGGALYAGTLGSVERRAVQPVREPAAAPAHRGRRHRHRRRAALRRHAPRRLPDRHRHLALPRQPQPGPARHDGHRPRPQPQRRRPRHRSPLRGARRGARPPSPAWWSRWSSCAVLAVTGAITGWGLVFGAVGALVVWPQVAEAVVRRRAAEAELPPLEWAGIDRALTAAEVRELDAALGLAADPEEAALAG